jgi:hypothetical protein
VNLIKPYKKYIENTKFQKDPPLPHPSHPHFFIIKNTRRLCGHVASPGWLGGRGPPGQVPTSANQQKEKVMHTQDPIKIELTYFHYIVVGPTTTIGEGEGSRRGGMEGGEVR